MHVKKPRQFEIIDLIYKEELQEVNTNIKENYSKKLSKLNNLIESRVSMGTDYLLNGTTQLQ